MTDNPYEPPASQSDSDQDSKFDYFASTFRYWVFLAIIAFVTGLIFGLRQENTRGDQLQIPMSIFLGVVAGIATLMLGTLLTYPIGTVRQWLADEKSQRDLSNDP